MRIGINGFGRIGRGLFRRLCRHSDCRVVAVNDLASTEELAHFLKYDSFVGHWQEDIHSDEARFSVGDQWVTVHRSRDWSTVPWDHDGVDLVVEATRAWKTRSDVSAHLRPGVRWVVITANCPSADVVMIPGITDAQPLPIHRIISASSCITQCLAAILQPLLQLWKIDAIDFTVIHQVSADQVPVDVAGRGLRMGRSALTSAIPIPTTAAAGVERVFPQLSGKVTGLVVRVPTTVVSMAVLTLKPTDTEVAWTINSVHETLRRAESPLLRVTDFPLVSVDYSGDKAAAIVDTTLSRAPSGRLLTLGAWFDNEAGYITRLVRLIENLCSMDCEDS